ncbi:iron chaperone [Botrimarina mediterranea]|uniref:iron chaperone n=1 Tax=Botrimarina mediterranea TaxID=2528022 RepID=UPI00118BB0E6|nr:hypothetical protein K2D_31860 [Planctomycetes bacterium K2D]
MAKNRPTTIADYIDAAPAAGQTHLRQVYAILQSEAPEAEEAIKWGAPFFIEPRFVYSFAAFKAHCVFAPIEGTLEAFAKELEQHETTKNYLKMPYHELVPEKLLRKMAQHCVKTVSKRRDDAFWA